MSEMTGKEEAYIPPPPSPLDMTLHFDDLERVGMIGWWNRTEFTFICLNSGGVQLRHSLNHVVVFNTSGSFFLQGSKFATYLFFLLHRRRHLLLPSGNYFDDYIDARKEVSMLAIHSHLTFLLRVAGEGAIT